MIKCFAYTHLSEQLYCISLEQFHRNSFHIHYHGRHLFGSLLRFNSIYNRYLWGVSKIFTKICVQNLMFYKYLNFPYSLILFENASRIFPLLLYNTVRLFYFVFWPYFDWIIELPYHGIYVQSFLDGRSRSRWGEQIILQNGLGPKLLPPSVSLMPKYIKW